MSGQIRRFVLLGGAMLLLLAGVQAEDPKTAGIAGVVAAGTPIELVQEGFTFTEGTVGTPDGGLFFTDTQAKPTRMFRLDPRGAVHPLHQTQGMNGLAINAAGDLFGAEMYGKRIVRLDRDGQVTATITAGTPEHALVQPNDLIVDSRGGIYFTDPGTFDPKSTAPTYVFYFSREKTLQVVSDQIALPNGLTITPNGRTLVVDDTGSDTITAFDIRPNGTTSHQRVFAHLTGIPAGQNSGADGMAIDSDSRVYVTSRTGVQVFASSGAYLGTIVLPRVPANLAFSGPGKRFLYAAARQGLYRIRTLSKGVARPGK
jgi:gluconolactonase